MGASHHLHIMDALPETNINTWKCMVGILVSFGDSLFSSIFKASVSFRECTCILLLQPMCFAQRWGYVESYDPLMQRYLVSVVLQLQQGDVGACCVMSISKVAVSWFDVRCFPLSFLEKHRFMQNSGKVKYVKLATACTWSCQGYYTRLQCNCHGSITGRCFEVLFQLFQDLHQARQFDCTSCRTQRFWTQIWLFSDLSHWQSFTRIKYMWTTRICWIYWIHSWGSGWAF